MSKKITTNQYNGHKFVEISGIKWATCNVGAEKPTDIGLYFQWGDRKGYTADEVGKIKRFVQKNYKHHNGKRLTKYNKLDNRQTLDLRDDAAFSYMGQGWRIPTREDFMCLVVSTTHKWTNNYHRSGVAGMVFTDRTDSTKELFFPAAGKCVCSKAHYVGRIGFYYSDSLNSGDALYSYHLYFSNDFVYWDCFSSRCSGFPVRGILTV